MRGASEHNLQSVDADLQHGQLTAITGVSGSGKSSLAFDTIYAEARRRFLLTTGGTAAAFADRLQPPSVQRLDGLQPALAIAQARQRPGARSTTATVTGIADFLRLLYARVGTAHCLACDAPVHVHSFDEVCEEALSKPEGHRLVVLAPLPPAADIEEATARLEHVERSGYRRLRIGADMHLLEDVEAADLIGHVLDVVVDRVVVKQESRRRLRGSLQAAVQAGGGALVLQDHESGRQQRFSVQPGCAACGASFPDITAALFSFNSPTGACASCRGTGLAAESAFQRVLAPSEAPQVALAPLWERFGHRKLRTDLAAFARRGGVDLETPLSEWPEEASRQLWEGEASGRRRPFVGVRRWLAAQLGKAEAADEVAWLEDLAGEDEIDCPACDGSRLSPAALAVRIDGDSIADLTRRPVSEALQRVRSVQVPAQWQEVTSHILESVSTALQTLEDLGLGYLTLDRRAPSLSAGELQRLHLVAALGSGLSNVLYVLDEPSAGLHPRDAERLGRALHRLRDAGNSVVLVEHEIDLIRLAERVIELGPGAGEQGGRIVASGTPDQVQGQDTPTGRALRGTRFAGARERRKGTGCLQLRGARGHNLQGVDVDIPLDCLVCVSGVSGSGKSSLVNDTLSPLLSARLQAGERRPLPYDSIDGVDQLERVVAVDQTPIGRSTRSNAATYTGLMAHLRDLFAQLPEARVRGYGPGTFSFNSAGACDSCNGTGRDAEADGFEDLPLPCPGCGGSRYRRDVLDIRYRDLSIADLLQHSVSAALDLLANIPDAARSLRLLDELGLGYLRLGQPASSLSGGEAQRIKLAAELGRPLQERTLYILDEPTAGLHPQDVGFLVDLLQRLVDRDNTVLVVEHDLAVIAAADHVIDMGPESGAEGGRIVARGTPEQIAACPASHTGRHLAAWLSQQTEGEG